MIDYEIPKRMLEIIFRKYYFGEVHSIVKEPPTIAPKIIK